MIKIVEIWLPEKDIWWFDEVLIYLHINYYVGWAIVLIEYRGASESTAQAAWAKKKADKAVKKALENVGKAVQKAAQKAEEAVKAEEAAKSAQTAQQKKAAAKSATRASVSGEVQFTDSTSTDATKGTKPIPRVWAMHRGVFYPRRAGVMGNAMYETCLNDLSWKELEQQIPKRNVHPNNEYPPADESDSEEEGEMNGYKELFWEFAVQYNCPPEAKIPALSDDTQQKLTTAVQIWRVGQCCPFISCRNPCWNPKGVWA